MCQKAYQVNTVAMTQNQSLSYLRSPASTPSTSLVNSCTSIPVLYPCCCGLAASSKLHGDVGLYNWHAVHLFLPLLLRFHLLVLAEVLDILRVRQVFLASVFVVVLLPVVDFVLVLIVAVVARAVAEIGELEALGDTNRVLCVGNGAAAIRVEELEHSVHGIFFRFRGDGAGGLVFQAVGFEDVVARPLVAAVVVVQVEEGAGVEGGDMVLLWNAGSALR
jgi:hypothetical protein